MYREVLRTKKEADQFRRLGDLEEFRTRAIGQWKKSNSHIAFAVAMKLHMSNLQRRRQKDAKNGEEKDEQQDEDGEDKGDGCP